MSVKTPGRHDEQDATRRARPGPTRRTRIATIVAAVALVAGVVVSVAYVLSRESAPTPAAAAGPVSISPKLPPIETPKTGGRALTHNDPLRLWVGGDSLAGSFGPALGDTVDATGIVKTDIDYKVSSGLASNDLRNWPTHASQQMEQRDPEAVMFIIGTNDTLPVSRADANRDGVPDWEPAYRSRIASMMDTFVGGDKERTVFWLGPPTLGAKNMSAAALEIGRVMRDEASKHGPNVIYVDTYSLFEGPEGGYGRQIKDERGATITARIADGVHFSEAGAQYLARMVFSLLDARFRVSQQADPSQPISWEYSTPEAEQVPGYTAVPRPRTGSSGSNWRPPTTPPTTGRVTPAPATTVPAGTGNSTTLPRPTATTTPKPPSTSPPSTVVSAEG